MAKPTEGMTERVGAWLTKKQLRQRNRELKKVGKRICRSHQGAALELSHDNFHWRNKAKGVLECECKLCHSARIRETARKRYQEDQEYVERRREHAKQSYQRHREQRLAYKRSQRRNQFAQILGVA